MRIKVGVIGCGSISKYRHGPEYRANPFVDDIVFFDRNIERARELAELFEGKVANSVDELFEDPTVVAISDCSSNESHHLFTTKALEHGKHVLVEKPIALTIEDAEKMIEAEIKSGKKLMVAHNQRFTNAHQKAKELLESGELGRILTFQTTFGHAGPETWGVNKSNSTWFFKKERSGLGVAGDLGIHKIDLLHYLLDDRITQVSSFQGALDKVDENGDPIEVCDNVVSTLKTRKGYLGTASFSWTYYGEEDNSTVIYCEKGILKIYHRKEYQLEVLKNDGEVVQYKLENIQTNDNQTNSGIIDAFIDCIRLDQTPPVTGEDGLSSLKVIVGMMESAETGKVVSI